MEGVTSYLEFGHKKGDNKTPYDSREGQEAYEFFMVPRYLKDIIGYRTGKLDMIHHQEDLLDNIKKYTALCVCKDKQKNLTFYEVGSSLMGVIDALEYIDKQVKELCVKDILFVGVDISDMMNYIASYTHQGYKLKLFKEIQQVECDLFFAKGISLLYAFSKELDFCNVLKKAQLAVFDYTFSLKSQIKDFVGTGKQVTYLNIEECKKLLDFDGKTLILTPSKRSYSSKENGKATYECVYGNTSLVKQYCKQLALYTTKNKRREKQPVDM